MYEGTIYLSIYLSMYVCVSIKYHSSFSNFINLYKGNLFFCFCLYAFAFAVALCAVCTVSGLSSFTLVLSRILCTHTDTDTQGERDTPTCTRLYRQIPDKWQFNNEKLKENTKYFFLLPFAEKELISHSMNRLAGNGLGK